jgi:hypothetical protein
LNTNFTDPKTTCTCYNPKCNASEFDTKFLGDDTVNNHNGEVYIYKCKNCDNTWLYYFIEKDYSKSGRWYRGLISDCKLQTLMPADAVEYLQQLDFYFYGGSFFKSNGHKGSGKLRID